MQVLYKTLNGGVAQWPEQGTHKPFVEGSTPSPATFYLKFSINKDTEKTIRCLFFSYGIESIFQTCIYIAA